MESQLLFHIRQEFTQYELSKLIQSWCLQEKLPNLGFLTRIYEAIVTIRHPHLVELRTVSWQRQDIGSKLVHMIVSAVSYWPARRRSGLSSGILFPIALVSGDTKSCTSSFFQLGQKSYCPQQHRLIPFLLVTNRVDDTDSA